MSSHWRYKVLALSIATAVRAMVASPAQHANTPLNDLLLRSARGEAVERTPVWLFRQAGRHMPEYAAYKEATGKHFLELLEDPKDVAEVTMQPLRRYDVDAAILFSDILVLAQAMGMRVEMPGGKGIVVPEPMTTAEEGVYFADMAGHDPDWLIRSNLKHVTRAITEIRSAQLREDRDTTLLGFSAAPWTLLFYMLGANSRSDDPARTFVRRQSRALVARLMDALEGLIVAYASAQIGAGAHAVQIFDAMAGGINSRFYNDIALPRLCRIAEKLKQIHPHTPLLVFARGVQNSVITNQKLSEFYDVVTLETRAQRRIHRRKMQNVCLQGNLDRKLLVDSEPESRHRLLSETEKLVADMASGPWIANIGEGLSGNEDPSLVAAFVDAVHEAPPASPAGYGEDPQLTSQA